MAKKKKARRRANFSHDYSSGYRPYVPVGARRFSAARLTHEARTKGRAFEPVTTTGRSMASTPWGQAWCKHIESFRDYENRLPRGRTYLRNGSVIHLEVKVGQIDALVMGSELYEQKITLEPCPRSVWQKLRATCRGGIGSLVELLEGRLSSEVMGRMTAPDSGLLPDLRHVKMSCSCPDWASLCKHLAAVLYGIGARLDERPELLFTLRGVEASELVGGPVAPDLVKGSRAKASAATPPPGQALEGDIGSIFGIELEEEPAPTAPPASASRAPRTSPPERTGPERTGKATRAPRRGSQETISRQDLLALGVPTGTISTWLHQSVLLPTPERGVYSHTAESLDRLSRR